MKLSINSNIVHISLLLGTVSFFVMEKGVESVKINHNTFKIPASDRKTCCVFTVYKIKWQTTLFFCLTARTSNQGIKSISFDVIKYRIVTPTSFTNHSLYFWPPPRCPSLSTTPAVVVVTFFPRVGWSTAALRLKSFSNVTVVFLVRSGLKQFQHRTGAGDQRPNSLSIPHAFRRILCQRGMSEDPLAWRQVESSEFRVRDARRAESPM